VPTVNTRKGDLAGVPIVVTLQKGEIYQLVGAPIDAERGENVAGTTVTSIANIAGECYPVAVYSGSSRTRIICQGDTRGSGDNIMQQLFPIQAWGKRYLTSPTSVDNTPGTYNMNVFRIIVKDPATEVRKNGIRLLALTTTNGYYYEYQSNTPDLIEADQPVLVAQYMPTSGACSYTGNGDPEMILISPIEQSIKQIGFYRNTKEAITVNYLSLIIPTPGVSSLTIDGVPGGYNVVSDHPNLPGYSVVVKRWLAAPAQCIVKSDSAFTAITYGMGAVESYGFNAGTYINNLNGYPGIRNEYSALPADNPYSCVNTPVALTVLMRYKPTGLQWKLSALAGIISPATDVTQTNPVSGGTEIINGLVYYRYSLPGYYKFSSSGLYKIPLFATSPLVETCDQTEEVLYNVEVKPSSAASFNFNYNNCSLSENIRFQGRDTFFNGTLIYKWLWTFNDINKAEGKEVSEVFTPGNHSAKLVAIDSVGCVADTTQSFSLVAKPAAPAIKVSSPDSCAGTTFTFETINPEPGVRQWYWSFGPADTITVSDANPVSRQFMQHDSIIVKHVAKLNETCVSDTAQLMVVVFAKPAASFSTPSLVCMPGGQAAFTNTSAIADGTALQYIWDFGDGSANSTVKDPVHIYNQSGMYNVTLSVVSENGCRSVASRVFNQFVARPVAAFSLPSYNLCQGGEVVFSDESTAPGSTIQSWWWNFGDGSTSTQSKPSKTYNDDGVYNVSQAVKNREGCISDTARRQLKVFMQPVIDAGPSFVVKENTEVTFQSTSNSPSFTFRWSPATGLNNPNILQPALMATADALFTLTATGENNCTAFDTLTVKIQRGIYIPNAFTPNQDGLNDAWKIKYIELYPEATVDVYDRYGGVIFNTTGTGRPWDGNIKGKQAPIGTYYYIINLKDGSPAKSGSLTLLR
jgi:gliding motility-associated-like protein